MVYGCEGGECEGRWFMGVRVESEGRWFMGVRVESVRVDGLRV